MPYPYYWGLFPADSEGSGKMGLVSAWEHASSNTTGSQQTIKTTHPFIVGKKLGYHQYSTVSYDKSSISLSRPLQTGTKPLDLAHSFEQFKELPMCIHVSSAWLMDLR